MTPHISRRHTRRRARRALEAKPSAGPRGTPPAGRPHTTRRARQRHSGQKEGKAMRLKLETRAEPSRTMGYLSPLLAAVLTVIAGFILFSALGKNPLQAFYTF